MSNFIGERNESWRYLSQCQKYLNFLKSFFESDLKTKHFHNCLILITLLIFCVKKMIIENLPSDFISQLDKSVCTFSDDSRFVYLVSADDEGLIISIYDCMFNSFM